MSSCQYGTVQPHGGSPVAILILASRGLYHAIQAHELMHNPLSHTDSFRDETDMLSPCFHWSDEREGLKIDTPRDAPPRPWLWGTTDGRTAHVITTRQVRSLASARPRSGGVPSRGVKFEGLLRKIERE
jgi:hypothetical protein